MKKIVSISVQPIASLFAIGYGVAGLLAFAMFVFSDVQVLTLPVGIVGFIFHLNVNFNLTRPNGFGLACLYAIAAVLSYAFSGWLTGAAVALCFNLVAKLTGGVDARFVSTTDTAISIETTPS